MDGASVDKAALDNLDKVRGLFKVVPVFGSAWWQHADNVFHQDIAVHLPSCLPYGGSHRGLENFQSLMATLVTYWENLDLSGFEFTVGESLVTVSFRLSADSIKTGKNLSIPFIEMWRFSDGKVEEITAFYWDTHKTLDCLGNLGE